VILEDDAADDLVYAMRDMLEGLDGLLAIDPDELGVSKPERAAMERLRVNVRAALDAYDADVAGAE
jgi:hypothetical protein